MKDRILTIDVGTGSTRAAILRPDGEMVGFAQREYDQVTPQAGWSEQSPSLWWHSACACIQDVLQRFADERERIAAIGVCGQMHGTVLLDADGELVEDISLLWNDKRSQPQVEAFVAREGLEKWLAHLNNPPAAAWPAFKLAWWRENRPQSWPRVAMVLMPKDYINYRLTGVYATDYSEASCYFLMDSESRQWSAQALALFGLRRDQLPDLRLSSDIIGEITPQAAALTGLPAGIPVVAGTSDMAATLLGSGVFEPGTASDSTGTSTLLTVVARQPLLHPRVNNLHLANPCWGGFTILDAGGDAVRWARLALSENQISHGELLKAAASVPAGAEGLLFLPYLTGERLGDHTNSRAQFFGLQRKHRRGHLFRAVLEGVAFASWRNLRQLRECGQQPEQMIASGGGARGSLWLQIKAAAYGLPILRTRNQENGTTGCAIIAGVGVGMYQDFASGVRQTVQFDSPILPDPRLQAYYMACCEVFDTLYQQAAPLYNRLDALSAGPVDGD
ncbi:xylulokinase [Entomohabitans teleogrylli]|uniref:xylulokinase n=1 Tax=Entomohabitans teleogrylli TaxID=1384589 RepID=UPI00073D48E3|nr:FGGY family carbohydrate kinase [Entomohabitans teleogrylli]